MIELPDLEMELLNLCLFEERFDVICEECSLSDDPHVIGDAVKNLLHHKLLTAINRDRGNLQWMYDGDRMRNSCFRITAKGMDYLN